MYFFFFLDKTHEIKNKNVLMQWFKDIVPMILMFLNHKTFKQLN